jgi:hypothetical protein
MGWFHCIQPTPKFDQLRHYPITASKAGAYPRKVPLLGRLLTLPTNIRPGFVGLQWQHASFLRKFLELGHLDSFITLGPGRWQTGCRRGSPRRWCSVVNVIKFCFLRRRIFRQNKLHRLSTIFFTDLLFVSKARLPA